MRRTSGAKVAVPALLADIGDVVQESFFPQLFGQPEEVESIPDLLEDEEVGGVRPSRRHRRRILTERAVILQRGAAVFLEG